MFAGQVLFSPPEQTNRRPRLWDAGFFMID
jgi:hypothetical protein